MNYAFKNMIKILEYKNIEWNKAQEALRKLQDELVVAYRIKNEEKVKILQHKIVKSFGARALAVRRVYVNTGSKTPGIDGVIWKSDSDLVKAIYELSNLSNYKAKPIRRIYIPKSLDKKRPLGIPTMFDRAVQALYLMTIQPIAEEVSDDRSYGFRPYKSVHDAVTYLHLVLGNYTTTRRWVMKCDIESFFDKVSHDWWINNVKMDKKKLKEFLKAGYMEGKIFVDTFEGIPQGGIISPTLANMALDGLEKALGEEFLVCRYADDFVVCGKTRAALEIDGVNRINAFLKERGVKLNRIISIHNIEDGFDFLGFNFKEYKNVTRAKGTKRGIFLIKPTANSVKWIRLKIKTIIKGIKAKPMYVMITKLNSVLRGWAEYYRTCTATRIFSKIGWILWCYLWRLLKQRHRKTPRRKLREIYFTNIEGNNWVFKCLDSRRQEMLLFQIGWVDIKRHLLCKNRKLNPYDKNNWEYFNNRVRLGARKSVLVTKKRKKLLNAQNGICPICEQPLLNGEILEVHHRKPRSRGGDDRLKNLAILHQTCHKQVTHSKNLNLIALWKHMEIIIG